MFLIERRFLAVAEWQQTLRDKSSRCAADRVKQRLHRAAAYHSFTRSQGAKLNEEEKHYLCNVESVGWEENEEDLSFTISANRFLHHMVRIIVGTMTDVGRGKLLPGDVKGILASGDRRRVGSMAPAHGLFLVRVDY